MIDFLDPPVFNRTLEEWQGIVDLVVRMAGVRAGLVMHVRDEDIEVFVSSQSPGNPYRVGDKEKLRDSGLYCERVIATQERLLVPNALKSDEWRNNPDIHLNMISYLGFPIKLPDGRPFGTICLLDDRENAYGPDVVELMQRMRDLIESHLNSTVNIAELKRTTAENDRLLEQLRGELAERARVEAELRSSQEQYRTLTESMKDVVWVLDPLTGRFHYVSPSVQALRGYTAEEVMAQPASAALTAESAARVNSLMARGYASFRAGRRSAETYDAVELEQPCKDGSTVWTEAITHYAVDDATGAIVVRGVTRDLTDRRRAAEQLRASEERYRTLVAMSPDGISVVDNTGLLLACNEQGAHLHGYDHSAEMVGRQAAEFYAPESFGTLFGQAAAVLQTGKDVVHGLEAAALRRDGSIMEVEYSIARVPWSDAPAGHAFVTSFRDVTQRNALLAELTRHRNHLEELVQARTRDLEVEIAERAAAQDALARSEMRLKTAERVARMGSWERNLSADELFVSDGLYRLFGLNPEMEAWAVYTAAWDAVHPEDLAAARAAFARTAATGEPLDLTFRIGLPVGEMHVLRVLGEVLRDAAGQPTRLLATAQDITERELARENLARRVQELTSLQELGRTVSLEFSLEDIIRTYLARFVTLADVDLARVFLLREGRLHLAGASSQAGSPAAQAQVLGVGEGLCGLAAQQGRPVYSGEVDRQGRWTCSHCCAEGRQEAAAIPLRSGGAILGVLAVAAAAPGALAERLTFLEAAADMIASRLQNALLHQEIQARAAGLEEAVAERSRELQTERDRTQAILETVGESVVVTDLAGQLLFINPATTALTGYRRDEALGQRLWQGWTQQARAEIWPAAQAALSSGEAWYGEITGVRKNGARYTAELVGTPLYDAVAPAVPAGAVWMQRDISLFKEAERLKDQFVSNVSHELRTPVSIIGLSCDNLVAYDDQLDDGQRRQLLQDIHEQAHGLSRLVEDVLMISRIDSGHLPGQRSVLDLARLVCEEVQRQQPLAGKRSQQLAVTAAGPVTVLGSEGQLRQVVRNLLDNAIKYTPVGGQIRCSCEIRLRGPAGPLAAGEPAAAAWAAVEVADNGIGIGAEDLPFIFQRFYRARGEDEVAGTGLGLSIARELTQLHGGWIDAVSVPGQGSTFTVYLPVVEQGARAA